MKRIVAIFLLVICVTLPLLSWGATDQCPKCGKYDTITTVKTTCIFKLHYTQQEHEMLRKKTIKCSMSWMDIQTSRCKATILICDNPHGTKVFCMPWHQAKNRPCLPSLSVSGNRIFLYTEKAIKKGERKWQKDGPQKMKRHSGGI